MEITLTEIYKSYGEKEILSNFSLRLSGRDSYCLMGPSGLGKTTLLHIMMGLTDIDSGSITGLQDKKIAAVFQEDRLLENLSGGANLRLAAPKGCGQQEIQAVLSGLLLPKALHQPVREMSGGMKRRIAIGRALIHNGDIIIMDEPFKGLDDETKTAVMEYVKATLRGKMFIWVTHDLAEAHFMGSQMIHL